MITKEIEKLEAGQAVTIDGKEQTVRLSATLHNLIQWSGSKEWVRSGKSFKAVGLDKEWLMLLPIKEGGKTKWFRCQVKEEGSTLGSFFLGSKENPGPARQFARTEEKGDVQFNLFSENWKMTDIGAFEIDSQGESDLMKDGDRLYTVISMNEDRILLYLDARPGEAKGIGASFIGQEFKPEEVIESIL